WLWWWHIKRLARSLSRPWSFPRDLIVAEFKGSLAGLWRYGQAMKQARRVAQQYSMEPMLSVKNRDSIDIAERRPGKAIRRIELTQALSPILDIRAYRSVILEVSIAQRIIGLVEVQNRFQPIGVMRLLEEIVNRLGLQLLAET